MVQLRERTSGTQYSVRSAQKTGGRTCNDNRPRVGLLLPVWCCGGVERYHRALAKWSPELNWVGCALATASAILPDQLDELATLMPVHVDHTASSQRVCPSGRIIEHADERSAIAAVLSQCDILLTWGIQDIRSRVAGFDGPIVAISHGGCDWTASVLRGSCPDATHYAAVSLEAVRVFPREYQGLAAHVGTGVETDRIAPSRPREHTRTQLGIAKDWRAVGYVGRFSDEKNPLKAAQIVGELGGGYVAVYHGLRMEGEGWFREEATEAAKGRIRWLGREYHTGDAFAALDCLVCAGKSEGGPLVAIEAWLAGVPIVSTPVGVVAENPQWAAIVDADAPLSAWRNEVVNACRVRSVSTSIPREAAEKYSAAALGRRWTEWLTSIMR